MPYRWNARSEARLRKAVSAYNAAITRREKELDAEGLSDFKIGLPERTTVADTKKRIHSKNDYRRIVGYASDEKRGRTSELNRILKKNDPHALDLQITETGAVTTKYKHEKALRDQRANRKRREKSKKAMETKLHPKDKAYDFSDMSPAERMSLLDGTEIDLGSGEYDSEYDAAYSPQELYDSWVNSERNMRDSGSAHSKADTWLGMWTNPANYHDVMPGYDAVIDAMKWLAANRPLVLGKMFDEGADEMNPSFIYIGENRNPYADISFESRHDAAVKYVTGIAESVGWESDEDD